MINIVGHKPGNPGGPGRPKGSKSQDTLLREELEAKQTVRENGRTVRLSKRRLLNKIAINRALEKQDPKSIGTALGHAIRLFPNNAKTSALQAVPPDPVLDAMIIRQLLDALSLGEPDPDCPDPWADLTGEQSPDGEVGDSSNGNVTDDGSKSRDPDITGDKWGDDNEPE